eukprot:3458922-Pyramimonas_sp.AAC.1
MVASRDSTESKTAQEVLKIAPTRHKRRPRQPPKRAPRWAQDGKLELRFRAIHPTEPPRSPASLQE